MPNRTTLEWHKLFQEHIMRGGKDVIPGFAEAVRKEAREELAVSLLTHMDVALRATQRNYWETLASMNEKLNEILPKG